MIEFKCGGCRAEFRVADHKAGGRGECPNCSRKFTVPSTSSTDRFTATGSRRAAMNLERALKALGLPPEVSLREAREAYRELAEQYHPDTGSERSAARFVEIVTAYEFLRDHVEAKRVSSKVPVVRREGSVTRAHRPVYALSYDHFVAALDVVTEESIALFMKEKETFFDRITDLITVQVSSYTSASEFRERVQEDVDAVVQRELRSFVERIGRRCELVEKRFRDWVDRIRSSAYEIGLPHSMMEYLSTPGGIILSGAFFLTLTSSAYLAMYMSPVPFFGKGPIPVLAGILATVTAGLISLWGGMAIYTRSARKRGVHERAVLMSEIGFDSFQVGAIPVSDALSSGERAGAAGAGMGILWLWLGAEPLTGAIATGIAAFLGWATGKSLKKMQEHAKESILTGLEPRVDDFFESFVDTFLKSTDLRLQHMRQLYLKAFGPDDNLILKRQTVRRPRLAALVSHARSSRRCQDTSDGPSFDKEEREALLGRIRGIIGAYSAGNLYTTPNIPTEKITNAVDSYAQGLDPEDVLLLYDATVFGGAKNGLCMTAEYLFWRNDGEEAKRLELSAAKGIHARNGKGFFSSPYVEVDGDCVVTSEMETVDILARIFRAARSRHGV